jgi:hypothetical protein
MTNNTTNGGVRYAEDILDEAKWNVDRLRDLQPREVPIHVPGPLERWKTDADTGDRARRIADRELREQECKLADAVELQQAEAEAQHDEQWNGWLDARLAAERATVLEILAEVVGKAVADLREEFEGKLSAAARELETERADRRRDRDRALERLKGMSQVHAEKVAALTAKIDAQQRAITLLEIKLHKTRTETARRAETEEAVAVMMRALYEEMMLRR